MKRFLAGVVIALSPLMPMSAFNNRPLIENQKQELKRAKTRKDSIRIYYNILDLSPKADYFKVGKQLDPLLAREGDRDARFEVARLMAVASSNDTVLAKIEKFVEGLPESTDKKETMLFVSMRRTFNSVYRMSEKERQAVVDEVVASNNFERLDKYGKIDELFTYVLHLGTYADSSVLDECLADMDRMIKEAGFNSYALQSLFNSACSNVYTASGNAAKVIANDRKLLKMLDDMEKKYRAKGRIYRNYDWDRFFIYGRMLFNYEALSGGEVNVIYAKIKKIAEGNKEVSDLLEMSPAIPAYWHYKNGRYAQAIPLLKKQLAIEGKVVGRKNMLKELSYAAQMTGDSITKRVADQEYAAIMDEYRLSHAQERYNGLRMKYQYNILANDNARLELSQKQEHIDSMHRNMLFMLIGWGLMAVLLCFAMVYWVKYRRAMSNMQEFIDSLTRERDTLKRIEYHHYESPGNGATPVVPVKSTKPDVNKLPVEKLQDYIINDVMYVASLVSNDGEHYLGYNSCCEMLEDIRRYFRDMSHGVNVDIQCPDHDFEIFTDRYCFDYVMKHIVKVAVNLSAPGDAVKLWCEPQSLKGDVKFICIHQGKVFPAGREELVFRNLLSYKNIEANDGAARTIVRMISFLMHNPLRITRNDSKGARCELSIRHYKTFNRTIKRPTEQ